MSAQSDSNPKHGVIQHIRYTVCCDYFYFGYLGGYYHGKLVFPKDFPFKPPRIFMITPNGRFKVNTRWAGFFLIPFFQFNFLICLAKKDVWRCAWSVISAETSLKFLRSLLRLLMKICNKYVLHILVVTVSFEVKHRHVI